MPQPAAPTHKTVQTPNPSERSLVVMVDEANFAAVRGILPAEGTLYGSEEWRAFFGPRYMKEFADFVYVSQGGDTKDGGSLVFSKNKTEAAANIPFRTTKRFGNHFWHAILVKLTPVLVSGFPLSSAVGASNVNANRYVMREVYIPSASEGSLFIKEEFTSPRPFNIGLSAVPISSAVSYDLPNRRGGFPECLHEKIVIPAITTTGSNKLPSQTFEATNFTTWAPYIISDEQDLKDGVYYRVRTKVFPPQAPEAVIRKS